MEGSKFSFLASATSEFVTRKVLLILQIIQPHNMKIKLTRSCGIKGACHEAGTSIDVDDNVAHELISMGKAEKHIGGSHEKKHQSKKGKS